MRSDSDYRLNAALRAYREACPDVEGSANFMPGLWQKIEARQTPFKMMRLTRFFVAAAASLCMLMTALLVSPVVQTPAILTSYVEALDSEHSTDTLAYADLDDQDTSADSSNQEI